MTTLTSDRLTLRQTADALTLDRLRLFRLGHYLKLAPSDPCIPVDVMVRARAEENEERRYRVILDWILGRVETERSATGSAISEAAGTTNCDPVVGTIG